MKKLTIAEFKRRLKAAFEESGENFIQLDPYRQSNVKIRFECQQHGVFSKHVSAILSGSGCPACARSKVAERKRSKTRSEYEALLKERKLHMTGEFSTNARIEHMCGICSTSFLSLRKTILLGRGCPNCEGRSEPKTNRRHDSASFRTALRIAHPTLKMKRGSFAKLLETAIFKCPQHGVFKRKAGSVLKFGCLECRKATAYASRMLDRSVWEQRIQEKHGNKIRLLGQYRGLSGNRRYRFKCYVCFNTWKAQLPSVGTKGTGCPHCVNQQKTKAGYRLKIFKRDGITFRVQGWEFQAISWILDKTNVRAHEILTEASSKVPVIRYKFGRKSRNYYPDIYIPKLQRIVEVKSNYTLGLSGGRRSKIEWKKNQAKAKAVLAAGFSYSMFLMDLHGTRYRLPKNWYEMDNTEVLTWMAYHNANYTPKGVASARVALSEHSRHRMRQQIEEETAESKDRFN